MDYNDNYCILAIALLHPRQLTPEQAARMFYQPCKLLGKRIRWTDYEKMIAKMFQDGLRVKAIAKELSVPRTTLTEYLRRTGFYKKYNVKRRAVSQPIPEALELEVLGMLEQGLLQVQIAKILGLPYQRVNIVKHKLQREGKL